MAVAVAGTVSTAKRIAGYRLLRDVITLTITNTTITIMRTPRKLGLGKLEATHKPPWPRGSRHYSIKYKG